METANPNGKLKIFCPTHLSVFEVEQQPQIMCEIVEHALSDNFPNGEVWEYCCDCQTFSPSNFGVGGKVKVVCPHCDRTTTKRFLCDECKIIAFDSDSATKGKIFNISAKTGIEPNCPGCRKSFSDAKIYQHECSDIEGSFLTNRADCPFCQKPVLIQTAPPEKVETLSSADTAEQPESLTGSTQCSNCGHWGRNDRAICGKCGVQINALGTGVSAGTSTPKTQLLGSICPNCGAGNEADSKFCNKCGQALKAVSQTEIFDTINAPINNPLPQPTPTLTNSRLPIFIVLVSIIFIVFIGIIAYNVNNSSQTNKNSANYSTYGNTSNTSPRSNSSIMNTSNYSKMDDNKMSDSSSSIIGRTGRLTTNVNIRSRSNKYAEILGTHYEDARVKVLKTDSYTADDGEYVTWYKVEVLENGYDQKTGNGKGNNWERDGNFGWMEAAMEGWMNAKHISLEYEDNR